MVAWARENAAASGLSDRPIRWLVDDCIKFVQREQRRGNRYDGIIMDPPSYGRGPGGEVWKLEEQLFSLVELCRSILSPDAKFFLLNSYTTGLSPSVMEYLLGVLLQKPMGGRVASVSYTHLLTMRTFWWRLTVPLMPMVIFIRNLSKIKLH